MKFLKKIFLGYCLIISLFLTLTAPFPIQIIFLPIVFFIGSTPLNGRSKAFGLFTSKLFLYYSFVIATLVVITGFLGIKNNADLISTVVFMPLFLFFAIKIFPRRQQTLNLPTTIPVRKIAKIHPIELKAKTLDDDLEEIAPIKKEFDKNRRVFLKLIGSAGLSIFIFSLFTKKAHGAFFGSVPGPGTVSIKDSAGDVIDPAINQPTDGYRISEVDDSSPAYYGFTNKDGAWFIMRESSGVYRYIKGASSFSTNWTGRAALSYDYYHNIF